MGVAKVLKIEPPKLARAWLRSAEEKARRQIAQSRRLLFEDNAEREIRREIGRIFTDETVRQRTEMFAHLACSVTLFRRVINELVRPVYLVPPTRTVQGTGAQEAFQKIVKETRLDSVMSRWLKAALATTSAMAYPRYVERLDRIVVDVIPADAHTVIPDPDDPCVPLAVIYDKPIFKHDGQLVTWHVYWDDEVAFQMDENDNVVPFDYGQGAQAFRRHELGRIPMVPLHPYERFGSYWVPNAGSGLVAAHKLTAVLTALAARKLKARGFNQFVVSGDALRFPKGQPMDEEAAILAPEGTGITMLNSESDAENYLAMIEAIETRAAADNGISRARLNQKAEPDDTSLTEQRAEMVAMMRDGEQELFEVLKLVAAETPDRKLPADAGLAIDFGEYQLRTDPKAEQEIWDLKRRAGVRNVLDQIKAENPEVRTDDEAWAELERNLEAEAEYVKRRRALNIPEDANAQEPGQNPQANGAMGPMVRDGQMSRDEAAEQARGMTAGRAAARFAAGGSAPPDEGAE